MSKPLSKIKRHNGTAVIMSTRDPDSYWQCGQWVTGIENATTYCTDDEAYCVISMRSLRDVVVTTKDKP